MTNIEKTIDINAVRNGTGNIEYNTFEESWQKEAYALADPTPEDGVITTKDRQEAADTLARIDGEGCYLEDIMDSYGYTPNKNSDLYQRSCIDGEISQNEFSDGGKEVLEKLKASPKSELTRIYGPWDLTPIKDQSSSQ